MNDIELERWSETLMELRQERLTKAQKDLEEKGSSYTPGEFFEQAVTNLDKILEKWVGLEQSDWDANRPDDPANAILSIRNETDSLVDLEIEAILRDAENLKQEGNWEDEILKSSEAAFQNTVGELRNKYQLKLGGFSGAQKKKSPPIVASPPPVVSSPKISYSGGSSSSSGAGVLMMFLVGLVLGVAPSLYFWDANNKTEKKFQNEKAKLETTQRLTEDNYAMLRDVFGQMASGKIKSLAEMESQLRQMRNDFSSRRKKMEQEFYEERERLMKKLSSGNKLDQALEELEYRKVQRLGTLKEQETLETEKLEKQIKMIKDLLAG